MLHSGRQTKGPPKILHLLSGTWEYVTLHCKGDFACVIKLWIWIICVEKTQLQGSL